METATQNSSFLLAGLISGQGVGAAVAGSTQAVENPENILFISSLNQTTQELQLATEGAGDSLNIEELLQAVNELLSGQTATTGRDLPLPGGQVFAADVSGIAADMSNKDVLTFISQLQGQEAKELTAQLTSLLQGQVGLTGAELSGQQQTQKIDTVFSKIRQLLGNQASSSSNSNLKVAEEISPGLNLRQESAVVTPVPVLLERLATMSNERQLNTGNLDWSESADTSASILQFAKPAAVQANTGLRSAPAIIQSPLTAPQWQSEFSDKVMMISRVTNQGQNQVAEIRLNPAHLGPIEVKVVMKDDLASITFSAQNGAVRDAIEASLPRLREMFNSSGMMLADANVSEHSLNQRQQQNSHAESEGQYGYAEAGDSVNEQSKLIDLSAILSSPGALDLYA